MCDTKWVLSNSKCHDMSEFEGRAVRKDDKYANENISETLSSRFSFGYGTPLLWIFLCEIEHLSSLDGLHLSFFICCAFLLKMYMRVVARDKASRQILLNFLRCCSSCSNVQEASIC